MRLRPPLARARLARSLFLAFALLLTVAAGPFVRDVAASKIWCRTDPVVMVDGHLSDIFVSGPLDAILRVTGPNQVVVTVPAGVDAWLAIADLGFGRGTTVSFAESEALERTDDGVEAIISVYVPARYAMPVRVEVAPRLIGLLNPIMAEGVANQWIVVEAVL
jgi:hypothetical protein